MVTERGPRLVETYRSRICGSPVAALILVLPLAWTVRVGVYASVLAIVPDLTQS